MNDKSLHFKFTGLAYPARLIWREPLKNILLKSALAASVALAVIGCKAQTSETAKPAAKVEAVKTVSLADVVADPRRAKDSAVDKFRNPAETLAFFDVKPGQHVAEVWPGYYTSILAPYLKENGGTYTAVIYPDNAGEYQTKRNTAFREKYAGNAEYGDVNFGAFGKGNGAMMTPGTADVVISRRNVHNWMGGGYAEEAFAEFFAALKPGGILGIVEHRLPETMAQDPRGASGYVQESYMKTLAKDAGFEFVGSSEINANPKDTADHPFGVWTLPPRSRLPKEGSPEATDFDAQAYKNIGESDRATLKFRKPG